jgi:hypothetical protein
MDRAYWLHTNNRQMLMLPPTGKEITAGIKEDLIKATNK